MSKNELVEIKVFGDKAKEIKQGDFFVPEIGSVEGRTVVTLHKHDIIDFINKFDEGKVSQDEMEQMLRKIAGVD